MFNVNVYCLLFYGTLYPFEFTEQQIVLELMASETDLSASSLFSKDDVIYPGSQEKVR